MRDVIVEKSLNVFPLPYLSIHVHFIDFFYMALPFIHGFFLLACISFLQRSWLDIMLDSSKYIYIYISKIFSGCNLTENIKKHLLHIADLNTQSLSASWLMEYTGQI